MPAKIDPPTALVPFHPGAIIAGGVTPRCQAGRMAFGQQAGPPATASQVRELLALLVAAGHSDFRDARGPIGFNQRQAGGKFTRDEADALIAQLEEGDGTGEPPAPIERLSPQEQALRKVPAERLAAELQRRGWVVMEP